MSVNSSSGEEFAIMQLKQFAGRCNPQLDEPNSNGTQRLTTMVMSKTPFSIEHILCPSLNNQNNTNNNNNDNNNNNINNVRSLENNNFSNGILVDNHLHRHYPLANDGAQTPIALNREILSGKVLKPIAVNNGKSKIQEYRTESSLKNIRPLSNGVSCRNSYQDTINDHQK